MTSKLSSRNPFRTPAATPNPTAASASSGPSPYGSALPSTVSSPPSYPDPNSDDDGTPEKSAHSIMLSMPSVSSLKRVKTTRPLHSLPRISPLNNDIKEFFRSIFVDGAERVVSYDGVSQYSRDGTGASACGLAALNFARIVFSMEQGGLQDTVLLQAVLARGCVEEATAICALWSENLHLEVEDICRVPWFEKTLELKSTKYGVPGVSEFKSLLTELNNLDTSAVAIITRPPEIIACLKLRLSIGNVFIIFDSHPRPSYPDGAGMTVSTSIEGTARRLIELLPTVDLPDSFVQWQAQLLSNYSAHVFVPHGVVLSTSTLWQAILESSLAQLSMQAEISTLRSQIESLKSAPPRLEGKNTKGEARSQRQRRQDRPNQQQKQQKLKSSSRSQNYFDQPSAQPPRPPGHFSSSTRRSEPPRPSSSKASTATPSINPFGPDSSSAGSSSGRASGYAGGPLTPPSDRDDRLSTPTSSFNPFVPDTPSASSSLGRVPGGPLTPASDRNDRDSALYAMRVQQEFDNEDRTLFAQLVELGLSTFTSFFNPFGPNSPSASSSSGCALDHAGGLLTPPSDRDDRDSVLYAMRLQHEFDNEDRAFSAQRAELSKATQDRLSTFTPSLNHFRPNSPDSPSASSSSARALGNAGGPLTPPSDRDDGLDSVLYAMRLQHEFDKEDRALAAQRAELAKFAQRLFECGICLEKMPVDSIARPDPCGHTFCRECLRGHVSARIDEHRFPVLCPSCTADKSKGKEVVGEVSQTLALDLGLTNKQYSIWTEMEMTPFSIHLYCRKCKRTMFVARDEHERVNIIACPLPGCSHIWCKRCQQSIYPNGPKHSCDGTSELDHLMKQKGWKYCPTCKTPIQKISGCNHMSCLTPACNTHFCYSCGGLIVRSALGQEINEATSAHYRKKCMLFEVPE